MDLFYKFIVTFLMDLSVASRRDWSARKYCYVADLEVKTTVYGTSRLTMRILLLKGGNCFPAGTSTL